VNIIIGIDDTDNQETKGTGHLVEAMCGEIEKNNWGLCAPITRHQLYVHEDIPYTCHNSAMCCEIFLANGHFDNVLDFGQHVLKTKSAQGSDPGLCVAVLDKTLNQKELEKFGRAAKHRILTKDDAYFLANHLGVHLSEHGGTGQGVIGAIAGIGLRLTGNDGRYRGWYHLGRPGKKMTAGNLCSYDFIDAVMTRNGEKIDNNDRLVLGADKIKTVLLGNERVVLVAKVNAIAGDATWVTLTKQQVKEYDTPRGSRAGLHT